VDINARGGRLGGGLLVMASSPGGPARRRCRAGTAATPPQMEIVAARKEWRTVPDPSLLFTAINLYLCILFSILFDGQKLHETSSVACS
jgi:hypothetical protein